MSHLKRNHLLPRITAVIAISTLLVGGVSSAAFARQQPAVDVGGIAGFPSAPAPSAPFDWKQRALDYDAFVYDWTDRGAYTTIRSDESALNLPAGETTYKMPAYYGDTRSAGPAGDGKQEAVTQIASVVGASLVGVDKSDQDGHDYVTMLRTFFHPELGVAANTPSASPDAPGAESIWYRTTANVLYYMLGEQYPKSTDMATDLRSIADQYTSMVTAIGGSSADFTMQDFDFGTMTKIPGRNEGGEAAVGAAAILLWAHARYGDPRYLEAAQWSMDALERSNSNLYYEVIPVLAPYLAARLNAEQHTSYDVSKYLGWLMQGSNTRQGWGTVQGEWGGKDISGLSGSRNDSGGYAFAMNSFATPLLAATAKYDARYADTIGRWMLNVNNAARFFYADQMPAAQQYYGDRYINDPAHVIAYEGLMRTGPDGILARGDIPERSGSWGVGPSATSLGLYGSGWVGFMGATLSTTNVPNVLRTDLNALDFFGDNTYPTSLYFNPNDEEAVVEVQLDGAHDLYDAVSDRLIATAATGSTNVHVPAGASLVLVEAPPNSTLDVIGNTTTINGQAVGFDRSPGRDLARGATATATSSAAGTSPGALVDGSDGTVWQASSSAAQALTLDLAGTSDVSRVALRWGAEHTPDFSVSGSADGSTWTVLADVASGRGGAETINFAPSTVRSLRLDLPATAGSAVSLSTIEAFGGDLAANAPVDASSTANEFNMASNLTDGSASSRWESATSDPQQVAVDLGSTQPLGTVGLRWETAAAKSFQLQLSKDGKQWSTVYSTTSGAGGTETIALPAGSDGRYVRLVGTERLTKYAYSLYALEAYSPAGSTSTGVLYGPTSAVSATLYPALGHGFSPGEVVGLAWDGEDGISVVANADGSFDASIVVPSPGQRVLQATGKTSGSRSTRTVAVDAAPAERSVRVSASTVRAGEQIDVSGAAFAPNLQVSVSLHSQPVNLGSSTTNDEGAFRVTVRIPVTTEPGDHSIVVEGDDGSLVAVPLTVVATPAPGGGDADPDTATNTRGGSLANTGTNQAVPLALGLALALLGLVIASIARGAATRKARRRA